MATGAPTIKVKRWRRRFGSPRRTSGAAPGYEVWDKAASIRFRRPGRGSVTARFHVSDDVIEAIRREADANGKTEPRFTAEILDEAGEVVAEVAKLLHVRRRG
jgi:hypothetical protein